jgi:hypothetical protein
MKIRFLFIALVLMCGAVYGQQPQKPTETKSITLPAPPGTPSSGTGSTDIPKPEPVYKLNPASSLTWRQIDQAIQAENERHKKELERFGQLRAVMLEASNIPPEAWGTCAAAADGVVVCSKPKPEPSPKP